MWIIWDNLTASIIVATVVLLLLAARQRMIEVQIEQTSNLIIRTSTDDFMTWMEDDLDRMGDFLTANENPLIELVEKTYIAYEGSDTTAVNYVESIAFTADTLDVRYQLADSSRRNVNGKSLMTFTFNRYESDVVGGTFGTDPVGSISIPVSDFRVDFLDSTGAVIANPLAVPGGTIKNTRVRIAVVTPYDVSNNTIRELYYGNTLLVDYD